VPFILSHQALDEILGKNGVKPTDLAAIDKLFGGADGYYWYHTMRHLCPKTEAMVWATAQDLGDALQNFENRTAEEDEVRPQVLKESHLTAIAKLLES